MSFFDESALGLSSTPSAPVGLVGKYTFDGDLGLLDRFDPPLEFCGLCRGVSGREAVSRRTEGVNDRRILLRLEIDP